MDFNKLYENAVIIAPRRHFDYFYQYRREYPFSNFVLMSMDDAENMFFYDYDDEAIKELVHRGFDFQKARDFLRAACHIKLERSENAKLQSIIDLRDEMVEKGFMYLEDLPEKTFENKKVVVSGYADHKRLEKLFAREHINATIEVEPAEPIGKAPTFHKFVDIYGELHFVMNEICRLIDEGVSVDDIYLAGVSDEYLNLLNLLSTSYGFSIEFQNTYPFSSNPLATFLVDAVKDYGLDEALTKAREAFPVMSEAINDVEELMRKYFYDDFDKTRQSEVYRSLFKDTKDKSPKLLNAVHLLTDDIAPKKGHVIYLSFCLGNAPSIAKDNEYLDDEEKTLLGLMTSEDTNEERKANLKSLLYSGRIEFLTFKEKAFGQTYFPSPLLDEFGIEDTPVEEQKFEYSRDFMKMVYASIEDNYRTFLKDDKRREYLGKNLAKETAYRCYNWQYKPFLPIDAKKKHSYSYSSVNTFYECQFRYFLQYVMHIDEYETTFAARIGTIYHEVLEHMHDFTFDFENAWMNAIQHEEGENGPFTNKENVLLVRLKDCLSMTLEFIKDQEKGMTNPSFIAEKPLEYPLSSWSTLQGRVDKIVLTGDNQQYVSILDYKTGNTDFDESLLEFGLKMQLPTYALLLRGSSEYQEKELIGLYIDHILAKKLVKSKGADNADFVNSQLLYTGCFSSDPNKLRTFEEDISPSRHIKGCKYSPDKGFIQRGNATNKPAKDKAGFDALADAALAKYLEADQAIRQFDFQINPKLKGNKVDSCRYCAFRDICYVRDEARVLLESKEKGGDENE